MCITSTAGPGPVAKARVTEGRRALGLPAEGGAAAGGPGAWLPQGREEQAPTVASHIPPERSSAWTQVQQADPGEPPQLVPPTARARPLARTDRRRHLTVFPERFWDLMALLPGGPSRHAALGVTRPPLLRPSSPSDFLDPMLEDPGGVTSSAGCGTASQLRPSSEPRVRSLPSAWFCVLVGEPLASCPLWSF